MRVDDPAAASLRRLSRGRVERKVWRSILLVPLLLTVPDGLRAGVNRAEDLPRETRGAPAAAGTRPAEAMRADEGVPFELEAHRVFVPVRVGDSRPLRLFLDTGLTFPGIFLFHEERLEELRLPERIEVLVPGAGDAEPTPAVMADSMDLSLGERVLSMQWVVISQGERTQGFATEGIIGATLFESFAVEIDYSTMRLWLHDSSEFSPDSTWVTLPIEIRRGIPWLHVAVSVDGEKREPLSVYIDLADAFPLVLLTGPQRRFVAPPDAEEADLGTGLSGDIHGHVGLVSRLDVGPFELERVRTAFARGTTRSKQEDADGILGNGLLERFHVVFDYGRGHLHLKPNERFSDPFE